MFTSRIGRLRFFLYSLALLVMEAFLLVSCIIFTMGFAELAASKPGPAREGLAAAVLVVSLVVALVRGNFAWRRSSDAQGHKWTLWAYIVFSLMYAVLQAATFLVVKFDGEDSNFGLNLLGLGLIGLWVVILTAKPAGDGSSDLDASFGFDGTGTGSPPRRDPYPDALPSAGRAAAQATGAPRTASPSTSASRQNGNVRSGGFGMRGLA